MASTKEIKNRINSINKIKKITKAMKLVAASKLQLIQKKRQESIIFLKEFNNTLSKIINQIPNFQKIQGNLKKEATYYVAITSDLGLCGNFNNNVIKKVLKIKNNNDYIYVFGSKGVDSLKHLTNFKSIININDFPSFNDFNNVVKDIISLFKTNQINEVKIIYNQFINSIKQEVVCETIFPINIENFAISMNNNEYEIEPNSKIVFFDSMLLFFTTRIFKFLVESKLSEFSLRRVSMENATDNANELFDNLILKYNSIRQAKITQEINEITAGANNK